MAIIKFTPVQGLLLEPDTDPYTGTTLTEDAEIIDGVRYTAATAGYWYTHYSYGATLSGTEITQNVHRIECFGYLNTTPTQWFNSSYDSFKVFKSADNSTWTFVEQFDGPPLHHLGLYEYGFKLELTTPQAAEYWKVVYIDTSTIAFDGGASGWIGEVELYGEIPFDPTDWAHKLQLTIDSSKVDGDLTDFPVLVTLSSGTGITGFDVTAVFDELNDATWNPSDKSANITLSNRNLTATATNTASKAVRAAEGKSNGKWYWEVKIDVAAGIYFEIGVGTIDANINSFVGCDIYGYGYSGGDGEKYHDNSGTAYGDTYGLNDIIGVALDLDSGKIWWSKNNVWQASGDPGAGTGEAFSGLSGAFYPMFGLYNDTNAGTANFGISSFVYTPPSGFIGYASRKNIAVTTDISEVETELYVEIERWDDENEQAYLWTKIPTIVSGTDTTINFYYDSTQDANTDYVGDTGDTPAQKVWDENFIGVWHMAQDPDGDAANCILDSTASGTDGTPAGTMTTADLVDGKVGKAIDFDGANDRIITSFTRPRATLTLECLFNVEDSGSSYEALLGADANQRSWQWRIDATTSLVSFIPFVSTTPITITSDSTVRVGYHYTAATWNNGVSDIYLDGSTDRTTYEGSGLIDAGNGVAIGCRGPENASEPLDGIVDESRISNIERSGAWIKATYYSYWNNLITFASPLFNPADWAHKLILTIDSSKVDEDLTDFPVLIPISTAAGITDVDATDIFDKLTETLISGTVFLLHYDGANDSNDFIDSSSGNHSIDLISDPVISTAQYKFDGSSGYFDGNDALECAAHADWALGTDDFTLEAWIRVAAIPSVGRIFALGDVQAVNGTWAFGFGTTWGGGTKINLADRDGGINDHLSNAVTINTNTQHHIRIVRDSGLIRFFLDGTSCGTSACTHNLNASDKLYTGCRWKLGATGEFLTGYMDEGRILKGVAACTSDFTPPDGPYGTSWDNRKKIAITTTISGIETELYAEIERWDTSTLDEQAWLWTKVPTIVSGTDTTLNFYYDSTQTTNSGFIGDTGDIPAQNVWDSNFVGVWHLAQDPNGDAANCILDSTCSGFNGTPNGSMTTDDLVNSRIGKGIDFDGSNDKITKAPFYTLGTSNWCVEAIINTTSSDSRMEVISFGHATTLNAGFHSSVRSGKLAFDLSNAAGTTGSIDVNDGSDHYVVFQNISNTISIYSDIVFDTSKGMSPNLANDELCFANLCQSALDEDYDGIIDEVRISKIDRSSAWQKATYNSNWDNFITWGIEVEIDFYFTNPIPVHQSTVYGTSQTLQLTVTVSGQAESYTYDATFYDATTSGIIGSTVSGTQSGQWVSTVMQTPSGIDYGWFLSATSSGGEDTSSTYTFTNKFKCVGTVKEGETTLSGIPVRLYNRDTGELVGYTTSTGISGTFEIIIDYNEYHYAVALYASTVSGVDPTETNALIYDWLAP